MHLFWNRTHEPEERLRDQRTVAPAALEFADDAQVAARASQPAPIGVGAVVGLLTGPRARVRRGPIFWSWMLAAPLFAVAALGCVANGEMLWALQCLCGLVTSRVIYRQASLLQQERAALQNSQLDN